MSVCLLLISDGRDECRTRTVASAQQCLPAFDDFVEIDDREHKLGFGGAIALGWRQVLQTECEYVFHLEQDFTFNRPVPVASMVETLRANPYLVQMALLRQPWNPEERAAGGIIQQHPGDYQPMNWNGHRWIEHRRFVTTNPAIWPRWVLQAGWPGEEPESEGKFGINLFASNPRLRSAFWGDGEEWVRHIGDQRVGVGY